MNKVAAVIGCGTIGAGWAARLRQQGWRVQAFDLSLNANKVLDDNFAHADRACSFSGSGGDHPRRGEVELYGQIGECVRNASVVIESLPEDLDMKRTLYAEIEPWLADECLLLSSTSGFKPTDLGKSLQRPDRFLVCHPFNPVYLIPLVEVVPHSTCPPATRALCQEILTSLAMRPLWVRQEIDGHIADRLLEAMWREALWLVHDDVATTAEIDDAIKYGFGLRMAQMGLFETYRLGGGEGGFKSFLAQFGPALKWPWSHLTDVPELDDALIEKIVNQSDAQTGDVTHEQRIIARDRKLVAILDALDECNG